jgi:hypothetical protein
MKYLPNINYYDVDKGIEYLKENKLNFYPKNNEIIIFHVYWYGNISRKQILPINSYLKTQNLEKTKLWVWIDHETFTEQNINFIPKHQNIEIKKYIPNLEAKNTFFEEKKFINSKKYIKFRSDIARLLFLYNYGGLYFDLDMILLKDLMPILDLEFCYSWSDKKRGNNGILRLKKKSINCEKILKKYNNNTPQCVGTNKQIFTDDLDIYCLPSVLFDPIWILNDKNIKSKYSQLNKFDNFFKKTDENVNIFFDNQIFAYHWHSRNNINIETNSYFSFFENKFK